MFKHIHVHVKKMIHAYIWYLYFHVSDSYIVNGCSSMCLLFSYTHPNGKLPLNKCYFKSKDKGC